jgi:riboflavin biosynthesis pyrimidine reductase
MAIRSEGLALEPLWSAPDSVPVDGVDARGGLLPPALAARFAGELRVDLQPERPTVVANFVSSLDGIVALGPTEPTAGGGEISGFSDADRFMMALLRGLADVVIVGAGTVRAAGRHEWTPRRLHPGLAPAFAAWRSELWLANQPTTIVVTGSGKLNLLAYPGLCAPDVPVVVATTKAGAARLQAGTVPHNVTIEFAGDGDHVAPGTIIDIVSSLGGRLALCEGGPHLFGELLRARLIDELFLTVAPQIIGRDGSAPRLALVEGSSFGDGHGRWAGLTSIRRAGDDIFLRYRFAD